MFITIYGINNIGKTYQCKKIVDILNKRGISAVYLKFPIYDINPTGPFINNTLRAKKQEISEEELQIWFTLNRYQFEPELKKLLKSGKIVIAEDYVGTALAWGSAKGANLNWLENLNKELLKEDLGILLEGKRNIDEKEKTHIHEQNDELASTCIKQYKLLAKKYNWEIIDAGQKEDSEKTTEKLLKIIMKKLSTYNFLILINLSFTTIKALSNLSL